MFEGQPAALEQQYAGFIQPGAFAVANPSNKRCGAGLFARRDLRALLEVRNVMTNMPADALAPQGDFGLLLVVGHRQAPGACLGLEEVVGQPFGQGAARFVCDAIHEQFKQVAVVHTRLIGLLDLTPVHGLAELIGGGVLVRRLSRIDQRQLGFFQIPALAFALAPHIDGVIGDLSKQQVEIVRLHAAALHHAANQIVVDVIFAGAGMRGQVIADHGVHFLAERGLVLVARDRQQPRRLTGFGFAEVDHKVALGDFVGGELVVRLLTGVDKKRHCGLIHNKAGLGHDVLQQRPCAFGCVVITQRYPAPRLEHPVALGHGLAHHISPILFGFTPYFVNDYFFIVPVCIKTEPSFPYKVEFSILYFVCVRGVSEDVVYSAGIQSIKSCC